MCTKNDNPEYYFRDLLSATVQFLLVALILLGGKTVPVYASVSDTCASGLDPNEVFWPDAPAVIPFKGADSQDPLAFRHYNASEEVLNADEAHENMSKQAGRSPSPPAGAALLATQPSRGTSQATPGTNAFKNAVSAL